MGTPFISLLEPSRLDGYDPHLPHSAQPQASRLPPVFLDAMAVREAVFVGEQGIPLAHEHDADDARSCHWAAYASVNQRIATSDPHPEEPNPETGTGTGTGARQGQGQGQEQQVRRSETRTVPIGTLRVVPFPHPPHPKDGARYADNALLPSSPPDDDSNSLVTAATNELQSAAEEERQGSALPFGVDRATTYHDGREPYVKIGRLAVIPEFRGHHISTQLWAAAGKWLAEHPTYFDPSVAELGMDQLKAGAAGDIPRWNGLVCCHAQESVVKIYERWGFKVDEGMGRWVEEGIPHVGMFLRLPIKETDPKV
ncbi:acyl-CoA N-acyltransferase [Biscogniauxia marginata]|nr:acyl-CoA N-acyltransferase [Biscogniauxia marginata]